MSWEEIQLGEFLTLKRGYDLSSAHRMDGDVPIVSSSGVTGYHNVAKVAGPGVVTGRYGTLGEVFFVKEDFWPLNTALYVQDFKGNDPRFTAYFLRCVLKGTSSDKAAVPGVNRNDLHARKVRVMRNKSQQIAIASVLSTYDDLIENNRRRIQLLEAAARLLYQEWFVHLRFPGHEHVTITDGVPDGWERTTLENVCQTPDGIQTGPFDSQLHQSDYTPQGVPVVMPKDIVEGRICVDEIARIPESLSDKLARHKMKTGDIVYGRRGDIGRRAFISDRLEGWMCGTGCMRLRPDATLIAPRFLFEQLGRSETVRLIAARATGGIMPNLNLTIMSGIPIMRPTMHLQREFVSHIEPLHDMIETLGEQNRRIAQARDLLLPRLMNGEVSV